MTKCIDASAVLTVEHTYVIASFGQRRHARPDLRGMVVEWRQPVPQLLEQWQTLWRQLQHVRKYFTSQNIYATNTTVWNTG